MTVDPNALRAAMRKWATGVTVVTTEVKGVRHGMTVNSFTSVSLTPPLVLVSLEQTTRTHSLVKEAGYFGVTILSDDQEEVSDCFAGRPVDVEDRFANLNLQYLLTGAPFITGGLAFFDCRVVSMYDAGTHTLLIAEVVAVRITDDENPLLYYNRNYHHLP